jgi:hypothetical protein
MSLRDCIARVRAAGGGNLTDDQILQIIQAVESRARTKRARSGLKSATEELMSAARSLSDEERVAALIEKRSRMMNTLRKRERFDRYDVAAGKEKEVIDALNVGAEGPAAGLARSVNSETNTLAAEWWGLAIGELRKGGLLHLLKPFLRDPNFERDVARELWRLTDRAQAPTGNSHAARAAEILGKYQEAARVAQNKAGAFIRKLPGWIVRQSHDSYKIAHAAAFRAREGSFRRRLRGGTRADFAAWRDFIRPKLKDETFTNRDVDAGDAAAVDRFLYQAWVNLVSGNHTTAAGAGDWLGGFKGPGNLAKRASQERVLHFKSADDWFDYNERFGHAGLFEAIMGGLRHAARNTALMRTWGTNPQAAFDADLAQLARRARDRGDFDTERALTGKGVLNFTTRAYFDAVTGELERADAPTFATIAAGLRAVQTLSKLGGVVLSSIPDIAVRASALRHHGIGYLEGLGNGLRSLGPGFTGGQRREMFDYIGVGIDGTLGSMFAQFSATDGTPGVLSKSIELFFRANLLTWWTDRLKAGVGEILARNLARNADNAWTALPQGLRIALRRSGIDELTWDKIRASGVHDVEGVAYLTGERVADEETRRLLRGYFIDTVNEAMTVGGAREQAIRSFGLRRGTPIGEAVRLIMQFKTYPITFYTRHIRRELGRTGALDGAGLAQLIVGTTAMGYLAMTAKELAKGRDARDPRDLATWQAAMLQGGGLGIYGDFLFGQYNRFGGGGLETLLGPTAGTVSEALRIYGGLKEAARDLAAGQEPPDLRAQLFRFGVNHAPFVNLFYTRLALDYLVLWHVQEAMSPGWARRFEQRIARENSQSFWLRPTEAVR